LEGVSLSCQLIFTLYQILFKWTDAGFYDREIKIGKKGKQKYDGIFWAESKESEYGIVFINNVHIYNE